MPSGWSLQVWPRWVLMWGLSMGLYGVLKLLSWRQRSPSRAPIWKHLAYLIAWPGMDVDAFLGTRHTPLQPLTFQEWFFAAAKCLFGLGVLMLVIPRLSTVDACLRGWAGMVGIIFTLHFGLFHLLSCGWRTLGLSAAPLMQWPILSESLAEFWGRRWNLAFRDLTHRFLFQPLRRPLGPTGSLLVGFFVSGLIHDLVISVPAGGGWGWPTLYFLLQGAGIVLERSRLGRRCGLGRGLRGWLYCAAVILLPSPWLFHRPFVVGVILPFLQACGVQA